MDKKQKQLKIEFPKPAFNEAAFNRMKFKLHWTFIGPERITIFRKKRKNKMYFRFVGNLSHSDLHRRCIPLVEEFFPNARITSGSFMNGFDVTIASE